MVASFHTSTTVSANQYQQAHRSSEVARLSFYRITLYFFLCSFPWSSSRSAVVLSLTRFVQQWPLVFGEQLIISPVVELFCTVFMLILCFLVFISLKRVSAVARQGQKNVRVTESFNVNNAESPYLLCCSLTGTFETCAEWLCWLECALNIYFCEIVLYIGKCLSPCLELPNNREGSKKLS